MDKLIWIILRNRITIYYGVIKWRISFFNQFVGWMTRIIYKIHNSIQLSK